MSMELFFFLDYFSFFFLLENLKLALLKQLAYKTCVNSNFEEDRRNFILNKTVRQNCETCFRVICVKYYYPQ